MKIKEAISILEAFKTVAGEDAECVIAGFELVGTSERKYSMVGYGADRYTTKVEYRVEVSEAQLDTSPGT